MTNKYLKGDEAKAITGQFTAIDNAPTENSDNLITSGAVNTAISTLQSQIDELNSDSLLLEAGKIYRSYDIPNENGLNFRGDIALLGGTYYKIDYQDLFPNGNPINSIVTDNGDETFTVADVTNRVDRGAVFKVLKPDDWSITYKTINLSRDDIPPGTPIKFVSVASGITGIEADTVYYLGVLSVGSTFYRLYDTETNGNYNNGTTGVMTIAGTAVTNCIVTSIGCASEDAIANITGKFTPIVYGTPTPTGALYDAGASNNLASSPGSVMGEHTIMFDASRVVKATKGVNSATRDKSIHSIEYLVASNKFVTGGSGAGTGTVTSWDYIEPTNGNIVSSETLSDSEYEALKSAGQLIPGKLYNIVDADNGAPALFGYKGAVTDESFLPANAINGDVYYVVNYNNTGPHYAVYNDNAWVYNSLNASVWVAPDYSNIETTNRISTNGGTWTVDRDGYVKFGYSFESSSDSGTVYAYVYVNNEAAHQFVRLNFRNTETIALSDTIPVSKNDVVKIITSHSKVLVSYIYCYFIPPKYNEIPAPIVEPGSDYSLTEMPVLINDNGNVRQKKDINGDLIYRRTFTGTITAGINAPIGTVLEENTAIEAIINVEGWWGRMTDNVANALKRVSVVVSFPSPNTVYSVVGIGYINASQNNLLFTSVSDYPRTNAPYEVTVTYTKRS